MRHFRSVPRFEPPMLSGLLFAYQGDKYAAPALWGDRWGSGFDATQSIALQRPSLTTYNGFPGLLFDGAATNGDNLALTSTPAGALTLALSLQLTSTTFALPLGSLIRLSHGSTRSEIAFVQAAFYKELTFFFDFAPAGGTARGVTMTLNTLPRDIVVVYNGGSNTSNASYSCMVDGVGQTVGASSTINATAGSTGSMGARATASGFEIYSTPVTIFRALGYSGAKTAGEQALISHWISRGHQ